MGEAIARFRKMSLAIRRTCDAAMVHPGHLFLLGLGNPLKAAAAVEQLGAGRMSAAKFADLLRQSGGLLGVPDIEGLGLFDADRRKILARGPSRTEFDRLYSLAVREAALHRDLLDVVERRLHSLLLSTTALLDLAGDSSASRYVTHKRKYATQLERWHEAHEALTAFVEQPPTPEAAERKPPGSGQKKRCHRKGIGGRKKKYSEQFVRDVLAARRREERACRKSKDRLPPKNEWLRLYCRNRDIDTAKMFPSEDEAAPEPWDERANRFWKAVAAREQRAGN